MQSWCNKHFKMRKHTSWRRVTAPELSLNSREAQVNRKSIWAVTHRMRLKGIERRWRKEVRDLSFLIPGGYSDAYSAVPQNIKLFSLGHLPTGKREPHPHPEHGKWIFFFFQLKEATESSGSTNEDRESYGSPGEPHNGMSFENLPCQIIPMETAKLAWQANNHSA